MPPTNKEILQEIRRLHRRIESLEQEVRRLAEDREELPRLRALAEELGIVPSTLYRKLDKRGIPVRDSHGFPKEEGDRSAAHVSRSEWEAREEKATRSVRKRAGFYDE